MPVDRALRLNDADGIAAAYAAHGRELFGFALRSLGDKGLAEEAVQTTYLRAWRAGDRFDEALGSVRTWLFAILRNVVIDLTRARSVRPPPGIDLDTIDMVDAAESLDATIDRTLTAWQVEEALRRLSLDHRAALIEVYYRGNSYEEAGRLLQVPAGTVKSRVYYALRALRLALDELGWTHDH